MLRGCCESCYGEHHRSTTGVHFQHFFTTTTTRALECYESDSEHLNGGFRTPAVLELHRKTVGISVLFEWKDLPSSHHFWGSVSRTSGTLLLPRFSGPPRGSRRTFLGRENRQELDGDYRGLLRTTRNNLDDLPEKVSRKIGKVGEKVVFPNDSSWCL